MRSRAPLVSGIKRDHHIHAAGGFYCRHQRGERRRLNPFLRWSINLNGVSARDVVWDFGNAKAVSISSIAFHRTLLEPDAAFTGSWGQLNGQLIAASAAGTSHLMLLSGAGLIVLARFRSPRG